MKLDELMTNPIAWLFLSICTVFAVVFAVVTWIKGKKNKSITYLQKSYPVFQKGESCIPNVKVSYNNNEISDFTITRYAIWNNGNETINDIDIVQSKPLTIEAKAGLSELLDADIILSSEDTNQFVVNVEDNCARIKFDYMDPKDGIILQVLHTGKPSALAVECKIKGGHLKKNDYKERHIKNKRLWKRVLFGLMIALTALFSLLVALEVWIIWRDPSSNVLLSIEEKNRFRVVLTGFYIVIAIMMDAMTFKLVRDNYYIQIPSKLRKRFEYK